MTVSIHMANRDEHNLTCFYTQKKKLLVVNEPLNESLICYLVQNGQFGDHIIISFTKLTLVVFIYLYIFVHTQTCIQKHILLYMIIYININFIVHLKLCPCICVYVCTCMCTHTCTHVCIVRIWIKFEMQYRAHGMGLMDWTLKCLEAGQERVKS